MKHIFLMNQLFLAACLAVSPYIVYAKDSTDSAGTSSNKSITLNLQAIQSNFISAGDPTGGNNGLPVMGLTTPIEINVSYCESKIKVSLFIDSFSFTLPVSAFLISMDVLPQNIAPSSAKWIDFNAGPGVVGHVFRDGSIRFSGPDNAALAPGNYIVPDTSVSFSTKLFPECAKGFFKRDGHLVRSENFPISKGLSNVVGVNDTFDYGEYYGIVFRNGEIVTATTDNSFDNTMTPIAVFNRVDAKGQHLIPQVDIVPPGYANFAPLLGEETLSVNPTSPNQLATTVLPAHFPFPTIPGSFLGISNDSGLTWTPVDALAGVGPLPHPTDFVLFSAGDQQCIFDSFGNLFYVNLAKFQNTVDPTIISAFCYVVLSSDGGTTWTLIDFITGINPKTFGVDYPIMATGPGPNGSSVTWLMLKQDVSTDELAGFGASLPVMIAAYKTTGLGNLVDKNYTEIAGTVNGGYGTVAVGPKGGVLITGTPMNNALGSLPFSNETIWYSYNKDGFGGAFSPIKFIANSNTGYEATYTPQQERRTWPHPNAVIDGDGRWYLAYVDQPTPHIGQPNPNIYLIYSDDCGKHWSTPVQINNDVTGSSFQFMGQLAIDPFTNDLAVAWLDSREDAQDISTRLWATVIKKGSLPCCRKA